MKSNHKRRATAHLPPSLNYTSSPTMPSSSSSTRISEGYDVFISFRGEDTRMGFTSHLYDALTRNDIRAYKDDKALEIGNPIASELLQAIETSKTAIVVFSSSFATSKWCLEEIAKIADCMRRGKLIVFPVFYHVSPSEVRRQTNCFEQGFADHKVNPEIAPQKLETWRAAFKDVGNISGLHVTPHRDEVEVINEILRKISRHVSDTMPMDNSLVGIKSRVNEVKRILRMESSEVLFIGICGMSGIGKTTLAKAVYKDIKKKFEGNSLIENIKDISKQNGTTDLCKLQQKLLDDILMEKSVRVQSVTHAQTLLGTKLRGLRVIVVLDDVNNVDQLKYLAKGCQWFGPGSRIIITTTKIDFLSPRYINEIYLCKEMTGDESLSLFCQSAFNQGHPAYGYEKLSHDIVKLAGGFPLAVNVFGKLLCGKDENYWKEMLQKLEEYPEKEVLGRLEVVYARLDKNQRNAFIYTACFLKGRNKDLVNDILTNIGSHSECGIIDLMNMCLITINLEDNVWMHDLLQQMCWKMLLTEPERYDRKHIAIKSREDITDVLSSNPKGMHTLEVINQEPYKGEVIYHFNDPMCFSEMKKLKFMRISGNVNFPQGLDYLSNDLRILEWYGCSLKSLPPMFEPKHIYELKMCCSQLSTLWKKDLVLPNLRSVNLSFSKELIDIPDLTSASNLVKLKFEGCTSLTRLHESVLLHKRLRYLNLKGCTCLESLGSSYMEMDALEELILSNCKKLQNIPEFGKNMKRLEHLYVDRTGIKKLPENLGDMCYLRKLDASRTVIQELPSSIYPLKKLRLLHVNSSLLSLKIGCFLNPRLHTISSSCLKEVDLSYCNLCVVPFDIGLLCSLRTLDLSGNTFFSLPASIVLLPKLRVLCLNNCKRLQSLPKLSLVDDDMDYGPRSRFSYYVSAKEINVSKFHASSYNNRPTVSCLNCPKLAVDKYGRYLAERVLRNYLELRAKYEMTPEAVFQIVGAGNEIPYGFERPRTRGYIDGGPRMGVAICAILSLNHIDADMEAKYMVTAHIHLGKKHWNIPVPVQFLVGELATQLVFYCPDPQMSEISSLEADLDVSFSMEPEDSNLHVTKVGVQFIHREYIKRHQDSCIVYGKSICQYLNVPNSASFRYDIEVGPYNRDLDYDHKLVNFTYNHRKHSLDGIYQITKVLRETNNKFFGHLGVFTRKMYRKYIYCYYVINLGASALYTDFVESLKDTNDEWLSVKWALERIVVKSRANSYSYHEMLQHLNDLEAPHGVGFSDNFISMFLSVCRRTFDLLHPEIILPKEWSGSLAVLGDTSNVTVLSIISMMAVYTVDFRSPHHMISMIYKTTFKSVGDNIYYYAGDERYLQIPKSNCELKISDFDENEILLQGLVEKVAQSNSLTKENEEEMLSVIDKLQKNIDKVSNTIQELSNHAHQYSQDLGEAKKHVDLFSRLSEHDNIISMLPLFNKTRELRISSYFETKLDISS